MTHAWTVAAILALSFGCSRRTPLAGSAAPPESGSTARGVPSTAPPSTAADPPGTVVFTGMCDASGGVPVSENTFLVADDEDNILRTYDATRGGAPIASVDVSSALGVIRKKSADKPTKSLETDIEAGTRIGNTAFFITSHGRNSKGKLKPERLLFFAISLAEGADELKLIGSAYPDLLDVLAQDPRYASFGLRQAAERAPKEAGALNIEGLTARKEGGVLIGFRNPNPGGKALIVPLLNPDQIVSGERARVGDPVLLDLDGLGVRSLSSWRGRYLIAAGHFSSELRSALYTWDGASRLERLPTALSGSFNPEGFFTPDERNQIMVLSDDGSSLIDGRECKRLRDVNKKRFRGLWLTVPSTG